MRPKGKRPSAGIRRGEGGRVKKPRSRKQERKLEREARKQRNAVHHLKGKGSSPLVAPIRQNTARKKPVWKRSLPTSSAGVIKSPQKSLSDLRKQALLISNEREDAEISKLAKLLKIRKKNKLPASFREEGLNYILELTEKSGSVDWDHPSSGSDEGNGEKLQTRDASDSEPEEMLMSISQRKQDNAKPTKLLSSQNKHVRFSSQVRSEKDSKSHLEMSESDKIIVDEMDSDSEGEMDSDSEGEMDSDSEGEMDSGSEGEMDSSSDEGSSRGNKSLLDAGPKSSKMYLPPHMRMKGESKKGKDMSLLKKQVQGLINRLSEVNMQSISVQLEQLYRLNSRNDMNETLSDVLLRLCSTAARLSDRFAMEHAMLVAILHGHVGQEVGAYMVQALAQRLNQLLQESPHSHSTKECSCVILILAFLYTYRVIHCGLVYDIIRLLLESLTERNIELLLILIKNTGMEIRKDDAASLKEIILLVQQKATADQSTLSQSPRVRFMLDTISALKTNNARKIPNYDPTLLEHMKRLLRGIIKSSGSLDEGQLKISLQDLLNADTNGRWWIVGSAWTGKDTAACQSTSATSSQQGSESWVLDLARSQRMTTDVRKNIFSVIMTSEDYADAFEKLMKLGLREVQEREIIHVLVDCCLQESLFNPYYAYVTFQYSIWDRLKSLESLPRSSRSNLIQLCSHLISTRAMSIALLKVVEFTELNKTSERFYKSLLTNILCDHSEEIVRDVFTRIAPLPHLKALRDGLLVFIKHYLVSDCKTPAIANRYSIVEKSFRTGSHLF